jgi:hypothetical protein
MNEALKTYLESLPFVTDVALNSEAAQFAIKHSAGMPKSYDRKRGDAVIEKLKEMGFEAKWEAIYVFNPKSNKSLQKLVIKVRW